MESAPNRELLFSRAYEHALRSAFAHGSALTDFRFDLPASDDIITFQNGNRASRGETRVSGYSESEHERFLLFFPDTPRNIVIPHSFLKDEEVIRESQANDLTHIAWGLIRFTNFNNPSLFQSFSTHSFLFHERLLSVTEAFFHLEDPSIASHLIKHLFPNLLETHAAFILSLRRLPHAPLQETLEKGSHDQIRVFLAFGEENGHEKDFFRHHLPRFTPAR